MPTAFVAKAEMALWPVAGWVCRTVGVIFVERDRRMQTAGFVTEVQQRIRAGVTVTVFPEGTVGDEGRLLPFRTGAFESVAGQPDMAVLPMFMEATRAIRWHRHESMTRHTLRVLGHARSVVQVRFGTPIPTAELDRKDLARASRTAVAELGEIRSVGA